jgi:hypothetical protein
MNAEAISNAKAAHLNRFEEWRQIVLKVQIDPETRVFGSQVCQRFVLEKPSHTDLVKLERFAEEIIGKSGERIMVNASGEGLDEPGQSATESRVCSGH